MSDAGPAVTTCTSHADCDDLHFCNGTELCRPGDPAADPRGCVLGAAPCMASQTCDDAMARCESDCGGAADADGDGHDALNCDGDDCDDADPAVYPGAEEICDSVGRDEDCNPNTLASPEDTDADGDGYVALLCCDRQRTGAVLCGLDCDDGTAAASPAQPEVCDGIDNDCDDAIDERVRTTYYRDSDGDLFGDEADTMESCMQPDGYVASAGDCDDGMSSVNPTAAETCNEADDDCDTRIDEEVTPAPATPENCGGCGLACPAGYECDGTTCRDIPVRLVAGGLETCALSRAGDVYCWGRNQEGQAGVGSDAAVIDRPTRVTLPMPALDVGIRKTSVFGTALEYSATACALLRDGSSLCWGSGVGSSPGPSPWDAFPSSTVDFGGPLTRTSTGDVYELSGIPGSWTLTTLGEALAITNGLCARRTTGEVACSDGTTVTTYPEVTGGNLQSGTATICATRADGRLLCWGTNHACQAAVPDSFAGVSSPTLVVGLPGLPLSSVGANGYTAFYPGGFLPPQHRGHTCITLADGRAYCWGSNGRGQLGRGITSTYECTPTQVMTAVPFREIVTGFDHTCAISESDEVWCWGANNGLLGTADTSDSHVPVRLFGFPAVVPPTPTGT